MCGDTGISYKIHRECKGMIEALLKDSLCRAGSD